jgi:crotonobetaine/carnitine-CoA ligase
MHWLKLENPEERVLGRILRRQAEDIPDQPYLLSGDDRYTYGQVNQLANSYAAGLAKLGVARDDTLAFLMKGCKEFVFSTFGAMKLGAIWVPTNVDYKGEWLRNGLLDSRARVLVVDAAFLPRVAEVWNDLPFEHVVVRGEGDVDAMRGKATLHDMQELAGGDCDEPCDAEVGFGDTAAVLWTSGTTGRAKGVMQSHNAWVRGAESGARTSGTKEGEVMYCCLPMHNSAAWVACVYRALVTGLPFGLDAEFSASRFWDRCRHYGATQIFTLGAMHMFLWQAPEKLDDADNPVRHASMIPLPDELIEPMKRRFGIRTIDQGYGQSEVMGLVHRIDDGRSWKPRCLGVPLPGIEFRLLDDDDREVRPGEVGEFCVRPTQPFALFSGYFNDPEATVRAWRNLWYHTGDLGRRDEDGDYFFVDRKADYIRYKGRSVSSFAIEAAIGAHPAVAECAAHGVTSAELESEAEIKVVVVVKQGQQLSAEALARFVNDNAPYFFVPRYIEFVDELPHTPTGRVQKFKLRERSVTPQTWDRNAAGFVVRR